MIDDYISHNFPPITGMRGLPSNTPITRPEKVRVNSGEVLHNFVPVTGKKEFADYVVPTHPKGYESGGLWIETIYSKIGRIRGGTHGAKQQIPINRKFESATPSRIRWLTGIDLVVDNSIVGEVSVHVANMESVAEMLALEIYRDMADDYKGHRSRNDTSNSNLFALVNREENKLNAVKNFWNRIKEAFQPVYLTATYGNYIKIEPKINVGQYVVHVYPTPPLKKVIVH